MDHIEDISGTFMFLPTSYLSFEQLSVSDSESE